VSQDKAWCVYILECADGSLYTGITNDMARRLDAHNRGTASRYTRARLPVALRYTEPQADRGVASKREAAIKRLPRADKETLLRSVNPKRD
jgi:predicted GIY-YIG superfamily endonuclease